MSSSRSGRNLNGAFQLFGGDGGKRCKLVALRFLAAEAAAHAAHIHRNGIRRNVQHVADDVLDFARVLRGGPDGHLVVLAGDRHGDVAFEVKMLLPADAYLAFQPVRGIVHLGLGVAALQRHRRDDERAAVFERAVDIAPVRQIAILDLRLLCGLACCIAGLGDHRKDRLAVELDLGFGKQRLVMAAI